MELPPHNLTAEQVRVAQYGLTVVAPHLAAAGRLPAEMAAFFAWSTTMPRLDRPNQWEHSMNEL